MNTAAPKPPTVVAAAVCESLRGSTSPVAGAASAFETVVKEKTTKAHLGSSKAKTVEATLESMLGGQGENLTQFV